MSLVIAMLILMAYMFPTIIAASKGRSNVGAISALNILLGWTFLGWIAALVWALTDGKAAK